MKRIIIDALLVLSNSIRSFIPNTTRGLAKENNNNNNNKERISGGCCFALQFSSGGRTSWIKIPSESAFVNS